MLKLLQIVDEQKFLASLQWRTLVTAMAEATGGVDLQRFPLYSFVLTTPSDSVFWPLQETFQELNELTGPHVLCVAPHVDVIGAAERQRKSAIQRAASILQNGINSRAHDSTTRDSIDQQLKATYA